MEAPFLIIADDHPLVRGAIRQAVFTAFPASRFVEAESLVQIEAALAAADELPDLLLLDLYMPGVEGFSGLVYLRSAFPELPIAVISAREDPTIMRMAIQHGALGFVPKSASIDLIREAIGRMLEGEVWAPIEALEEAPLGAGPDRIVLEKLAKLTPQQIRVLAMLGEGMLNKQIAHELGISEATVKAHVSAILAKLGVDNRTQAVILAAPLLQSDWISVPAGALESADGGDLVKAPGR